MDEIRVWVLCIGRGILEVEGREKVNSLLSFSVKIYNICTFT